MYKMRNWHREIQPQLGYMRDFFTFVPEPPMEPGRKPYIATEIPKRLLEEYGEFEYFKGAVDERKLKSGQHLRPLPNGESIWIGGMQKWVVDRLWLVMEDPRDGIFIFYPFMNDPKCMQFLGKLNESCPLYKVAIKKFNKCVADLIK